MNFNFGKRKPNIKQYAIIGIVLSSIIATLSQCTGISQNNIWDLLDEVQRKYFPQTILNEFIINDDKQIQRRINRDVDRAINEAIPEYNRFIEEEDEKYKPIYKEMQIDTSVCYTDKCKALGGEIRICSPWISDCIKND